MFPRVLLVIAGAVFLGFGIASWMNPELPADTAGLFIGNQDGLAEITATYGGLQASLGAVMLASALIKSYLKPGLWLMVICIGSLGAARATVAFGELGSQVVIGGGSLAVNMPPGFTSYTWIAIGFEVAMALLAAIALFQNRKN